jgi:hypothetical protein
LIEETYYVEFDESNGSQEAHEIFDDVSDEPLREAMKNILVGDIKPKDDEDEVHVIDPPSSSSSGAGSRNACELRAGSLHQRPIEVHYPTFGLDLGWW